MSHASLNSNISEMLIQSKIKIQEAGTYLRASVKIYLNEIEIMYCCFLFGHKKAKN